MRTAFALRRAFLPVWLVAASTVAFLSAPVRAAQGDSAPAPRASLAVKGDSVTVPFEERGGHLYVTGSVNDKPARFIIDTGAGGNVFTPAAAARFGFAAGASVTVNGAGAVEAYQATVRHLEAGGAVVENEIAIVTPLPSELECDGLLGYGFLSRFVTTLDYENKRITWTRAGKWKPSVRPDADLKLFLDKNLPHVDGAVDGIKGRFELDAGNQGALILYKPFVDKNGLRTRYSPRIETITGRGVGGYLYGDLVRVPSLTLGELTLNGVVAELSRQETGAFFEKKIAGNIGADILRRFTVTLDYGGKRVYLTKNRGFNAPFNGNRSGLGADYENGRFFIVAVVPGGPGDEAGVKVGDTIIAIGDTPINKITPSEARERMRGPAGTVVELRLRTGDTGPVRTVKLTLRDLI